MTQFNILSNKIENHKHSSFIQYNTNFKIHKLKEKTETTSPRKRIKGIEKEGKVKLTIQIQYSNPKFSKFFN